MFERRLTIAAPCYNSFERLCRFLPDLLSLDYPRSMIDLVFVDNGSEDETIEALKLFKEGHRHEYASITVESIPRTQLRVKGVRGGKQSSLALTKKYNTVNARNRAVELSPRGNDMLCSSMTI